MAKCPILGQSKSADLALDFRQRRDVRNVGGHPEPAIFTTLLDTHNAGSATDPVPFRTEEFWRERQHKFQFAPGGKGTLGVEKDAGQA